jgi:hypothetical protein
VIQSNSWPRPRDYQDAIQAPLVCFTNPHLRNAQIYTNGMGLPLAASGKSAIVFKAAADAEDAAAASKDVALRCFTRAASDQRLRYQELHAHLGPKPPPYMVDFTYWDQEIVVGPGRFPLVEMSWVEGDPLDVWIQNHLGRGSDLADQASAWLSIVDDMRIREMAHGDLANDNCLVNGSELTLIDYDGCFIPQLADKHPGEDGNPHFQHPKRSGHYAGNMDAFPAVVIFLSLLALQSDRSLWQQFHTDKNLIFLAADYKAPRRTPIWSALKKNPDARVAALTDSLANMCESPVASLPSLKEVAALASIPLGQPLGRMQPGTNHGVATPGAGPWWEQEALRHGPVVRPTVPTPPAGPVPPAVPVPPTVPPTPSWLGDHVPGQPYLPPQGQPYPPPQGTPVQAPAWPQVPPLAGPPRRRTTPGPVTQRPEAPRPATPARPPARTSSAAATIGILIAIVLILVIVILVLASL